MKGQSESIEHWDEKGITSLSGVAKGNYSRINVAVTGQNLCLHVRQRNKDFG